MSESCNHQCDSCNQNNCSSRNAGVEKVPANPSSHIKKVYAVMSGKGGVGKSLVTSLLAVLAQRKGLKTAVLDGDIIGPSIPRMFQLNSKAMADHQGILPVQTKTGIEVMSMNLLLENETDPVVWRGPIIGGAVKQFWTDVVWGDIDVMFVDMPPGTADVALTLFQSLPVDGVILVTTPQDLVSMIVEKAVKMAGLMNVPVLALVENMSYFTCPDCDKTFYPFGESNPEETAKAFGIDKVARIPVNPKLTAASDRGMIELFEGDWLDELAGELLD